MPKILYNDRTTRHVNLELNARTTSQAGQETNNESARHRGVGRREVGFDNVADVSAGLGKALSLV